MDFTSQENINYLTDLCARFLADTQNLHPPQNVLTDEIVKSVRELALGPPMALNVLNKRVIIDVKKRLTEAENIYDRGLSVNTNNDENAFLSKLQQLEETRKVNLNFAPPAAPIPSMSAAPAAPAPPIMPAAAPTTVVVAPPPPANTITIPLHGWERPWDTDANSRGRAHWSWNAKGLTGSGVVYVNAVLAPAANVPYLCVKIRGAGNQEISVICRPPETEPTKSSMWQWKPIARTALSALAPPWTMSFESPWGPMYTERDGWEILDARNSVVEPGRVAVLFKEDHDLRVGDHLRLVSPLGVGHDTEVLNVFAGHVLIDSWPNATKWIGGRGLNLSRQIIVLLEAAKK